MRCGLLGEKLGHSYSKAIHERLGGYSYELIECPRAELDAFMKGGSFDAINVTIPYKKEDLQISEAAGYSVYQVYGAQP